MPAWADECLTTKAAGLSLHGTTYFIGSKLILKLDYPICIGGLPSPPKGQILVVTDIQIDKDSLRENKDLNDKHHSLKSLAGKRIDVDGSLDYFPKRPVYKFYLSEAEFYLLNPEIEDAPHVSQ
jgi:hypothetical protein